MDDSSRSGSPEKARSDATATPDREARRGELRAAVKRRLVDIEEGRVVDLGEALDRIEAMLDELESIKPSAA